MSCGSRGVRYNDFHMEPLTWTALEYDHYERSNDWYWSLGILGLGGAILAIVFGNVIFALFIILSTVLLGLRAYRYPREALFEINEKGVRIDTTIYPYASLYSYDIHEHHRRPMVIIKSQKMMMPYITLPLEDVTPDDVRLAFRGRLPQEEIPPSLIEKIMSLFGL
jgi:hypothetical protein